MTKILCVDDDPINLQQLEALLTPFDYIVLKADSGAAALAFIKKENPDLVLLDILMADISGYDVLKKIREDINSRDIPVIMVTALQNVKDRIIALEAGCDDYISKPYDITELLTRIKSLIKISYFRRQLDEKEILEAIIRDLSDAVVICSSDWTVTETNSSARALFDLSEPRNFNLLKYIYDNYAVPLPFDALKNPSPPHKLIELTKKAKGTEPPRYFDGEIYYISRSEAGVSSIVLVMRDVTTKRRTASIGLNFIELISSRLMTPEAILLQDVANLKGGLYGTLNERQTSTLSDIQKRIEKLGIIFESLGVIMKINSEAAYIAENVHINISDLIEETKNKIMTMYPEKTVLINLDTTSKTLTLPVSLKSLKLVFFNLFDNSVKFNNNHEIKIDIHIASDGEKAATLSFSDNGIGIEASELENIFKMFYQVIHGDTSAPEGFGLGLAIVREIIEASAGTVTAKSKGIGKGSTIILTLPVK